MPTEKIATPAPSQGPTPAPSTSPSNLPTQTERLGDDQSNLDGDSPSYWYPTSNACTYSDDYPTFMAQLNSTRFPFLSNTKEVCCANFQCDDEAVSTTAPSKQPSSAPSSSPTNLPTAADTLLSDNDENSDPSYWYPIPRTCIFSNDYPPYMSMLNSTRYPFLSNSKEACCANYSCDDVSISTPAPTEDAPNQTPSPSPGSTSLTPTSREPTSGSPTSGSPTSGSPVISSSPREKFFYPNTSTNRNECLYGNEYPDSLLDFPVFYLASTLEACCNTHGCDDMTTTTSTVTASTTT